MQNCKSQIKISVRVLKLSVLKKTNKRLSIHPNENDLGISMSGQEVLTPVSIMHCIFAFFGLILIDCLEYYQ